MVPQQRFRGEFDEDFQTLEGLWEMAEDGKTWRPWMRSLRSRACAEAERDAADGRGLTRVHWTRHRSHDRGRAGRRASQACARKQKGPAIADWALRPSVSPCAGPIQGLARGRRDRKLRRR